ncbi:hypothetical protein BGW80DRAFT_1476814 [Lactifluus volemus]|nr:hypothetical protein BGW80DRAFT_1476814 [Lactifluus volemus]
MTSSHTNTPSLNEAKAPLGHAESKSVAALKAAVDRRHSLPLSTVRPSREDSNNASRQSTPLQRIKLRSDSRPPTPGSCQPTVAHVHALHSKQPVRTRQQFYDRLALIDRSVAHSQDAHFRHHLLRVSESQDTCDRLLSRIDQVDTAVASMLDKRKSVEDGGKCLQDASQKFDKQDQLVELQTAIGMTLEYLLSSLVLQTDFLYMVERVDICIEFLKPHRNYKEAEVYLLRFQQCMTCAMTFIKMYSVGSLRALTQDVSRRLFEQDVTDTAQMHLLYTRFTTVAGQLAPLLGEFERRAHSHPEELGALLSECHGAYFGARKNLLVSRLTEQIRGLDPTRTELVELICTEEFDLYRAFFSTGKQELYQYLETLCDYLYDDLRPRILHEPRLTVLCEVCTVLQALMVLDQPLEDEIEENEEKNDDLGRLHIRHLLQMVLQDAQTRLFFKAQAVIQSEIRYYTPTTQDLAYPDKLAGMRSCAGSIDSRENLSISRLFEDSGLNQRETWYPTLSKAVWPIYDLAHDAVGLCHGSLLSAAGLVRAKSGFDGQLFLVRYLLILKEITRNLDLAQKDELQAGVGGGAADQYGVGGIDQDLKHACESVISAASEPLCTPLRAFTGRPASAAEAAVLDEAFRNTCTSDLRESIVRVRLYHPDVRTAGVLVQHELDRVEDAYSGFGLTARQVGARAGKGQDCFMDDGLLKKLLQDVREDGAESPPART